MRRTLRRMASRELTVKDQADALLVAARLTAKASIHPKIRETALIITHACKKNDGDGQMQAIYDAVKEGHPDVRGLEKGVKYVRDPVLTDFFTSPVKLLKQCEADDRTCSEDCDGHGMLIAALCASIGLRSGLRAFKPDGKKSFTHVYAVASPDINAGDDKPKLHGMDTTIDRAYVGWEPSPGKTMTVLLEDLDTSLGAYFNGRRRR